MIIRVKYLFGYKAMALWPFILVVGTANAYTLNHERLHHRQQLEMLVIGFYLWYLVEYLVRLIQHKNHNKAYMAISFEKEAYAMAGNLNYLKYRKFLASLKYL